MRHISIKIKILAPAIVIALALAAAILLSNIMQFSDFVDNSMISRVNSASKEALIHLELYKAKAEAASVRVANHPDIIDAMSRKSRKDLTATLEAIQEEAGVEFCTVTDKGGNVLARLNAPGTEGANILHQANVRSALDGTAMTTVEQGGVIRLSARAGAPVYGKDGGLLGAVSAGCRMDTQEFVDSIKDTIDCEVTVVLGDMRIATTIRNEDGAEVVGTRADPHIYEAVMAGDTYSGRVNIVGRTAVAKYTPIFGPEGKPIGMIFVGQYLEHETRIIMDFVRGGALITAVMTVIAIVVIMIYSERVVRPIRTMTQAASDLASGRVDLNITADTNDETLSLADAFNRMIENTRRQVRSVEQIARGEDTLSIEPRSDKDLMNIALKKLNATIQAQAAAIREEHDRIKLMLDATPLASRLWDKNYNLIECNEEAVKLFNLRDKQEYLDRYYELSPEYQPDGVPTREKAVNLVREAFEKGAAAADWLYRLDDGTLMPAELTLVRLPYADSYVVATYSRDLREQKKMLADIEERDRQLSAALKEAKDANNAKGDFLARMSHEMRTPLNAVIGLSEITLDHAGLNLESRDNLEKIYKSGSTLLSIVNDILDISKIESGKFVIVPAPYDLPSLINDSALQNVIRIGSKPLGFLLDIEPGLPARLIGDELRIRQIINNLLSNAIKYTEEGSVRLSLRCGQNGASGEDVLMTISVADTGPGIKPENLAYLFDSFKQFTDTSKSRVEGTGLGLAITKSLAELMGGRISVESEPGRGSTFTVRLPQKRASGEAIGPEVVESLKHFQYSVSKLDRKSAIRRVQLPYARVLVVDDNFTNLDVAKGLLKPYGINVDCVGGGQDAIALIREEKVRYDAVFMDHMMPGLDGIQATRIIREEIGTKYAKTVPVIALTANAIAGNEEMFLSRGFQAFISKPIDIEKLDRILREFVRDKARERAFFGTEPGTRAASVPPPRFAGIAVDGVDVEKALEHFSGDEEVLLDVLRSYARGTGEVLAKLRLYLERGSLSDYAIAVHGIKGSSYSVSAHKLGAAAEALERYAKNGDLASVMAAHGEFENMAAAILENIGKALVAAGASFDTTPAVVPDPGRPQGELVFPGARVLVVDDDGIQLKAMLSILKSLKIETDAAQNGEQALKMAEETDYDLIFMDYLMPVMDGIKATGRLRQLNGARFKSVPVVALSADREQEVIDAFLKAGASDFAAKPMAAFEMREKLKRWLPRFLREIPGGKPQEELPEIKGINSFAGIEHSGSRRLFISLLGDFYRLIDLKAEYLEHCLGEGRLNDLGVEAHALKNAARMLGAETLCESLEGLERLSTEENAAALKTALPRALTLLRDFKPRLKPFGETARQKRQAADGEPAVLLEQLISAMERFDLDGADAVFGELEKLVLPPGLESRMARLGAYLADVAGEKVAACARDMIDTIEKTAAQPREGGPA